MIKSIKEMINNPIEAKAGNWHSFTEIYSDNENTIEVFFEKFITEGGLYTTQSVMANIFISSSYFIDEDEVQEDRTLQFDIYGSEMIPYNHLIAKNEVCDVIRAIAKLTGRKYTFHSCGEPMFTITPEKTIYWTEA